MSSSKSEIFSFDNLFTTEFAKLCESSLIQFLNISSSHTSPSEIAPSDTIKILSLSDKTLLHSATLISFKIPIGKEFGAQRITLFPFFKNVSGAPAFNNFISPLNQLTFKISNVDKTSSSDFTRNAEFVIFAAVKKLIPDFIKLSMILHAKAPSTAALPPVPIPSLSMNTICPIPLLKYV